MNSHYSSRIRAFAAALPLLAALAGCTDTFPTPVGPPLEALFARPGPATEPDISAKPRFQRAAIFESIPERVGSHAPTITALPDGELLAAWYSYRGPHELDGSAIYMARRLPGASAWTEPSLSIDDEFNDGNPVLYSEGEHIWLFHASVPGLWSSARIRWSESDDRGHSWSRPGQILGPIGSNVRFPPVRSAAGTLILPAYDDLLRRSLFFAWDDNQWRLRAALSTGFLMPNIQPSIVPLSDGSLLSVMRNTGRGWLWASVSSDDAFTWTRPTDSGFDNFDASTALLRLRSGNLLLVTSDTHSDSHRLFAMLSADEGRSWLPPRTLVEGSGEYTYPAVAETNDGVIHLLFSDNRERISHVETNEAFIANNSTVAGPTSLAKAPLPE